MKGLYAWKRGMTRIFSSSGKSIPVTVLEVEPNAIFQIKTKEKDGYEAIQVGIGSQKPQRVNRARSFHCAKAEKGMPQFLGEIKSTKVNTLKVGDIVNIVDVFKEGEKVDVIGTTIGKGFAGVIKRHGMAGFNRTHGTHEYFRHGGSIGNRKFPGRVFKNKRMPGHMGVARVTQENLEVALLKSDGNLLLIKGSVPGNKGEVVFVRKALKAKKPIVAN